MEIVVGRLTQMYLEKYIMKTSCMISSQTGYMWLFEVLKVIKVSVLMHL